jgi:ParB-like chromosome segregation protein Spo0J
MAGNTAEIPNETISIVHAEPDLNIEPAAVETEIQSKPELKIDPEFKVLMADSSGESGSLEENISLYGCRDPIIVLKGEGIILDGHHRYEICERLGIPYQVVELEFPSRTEAKIWMIKNQRGRRNLNESQRAMLAVTLEALYFERARERQGTRTDLGQNLDPSEAGRSAEKAAKDMGVSHQTVSYAKKVATKGIPELAKLVASGDLAVSAAAMATSHPPEVQKNIVQKAQAEIEDGKKPHIASFIRDINTNGQNGGADDADKRLDRLWKSQEAGLKLLNGIERIRQPENLVGIRGMTLKIAERLTEIEAKSLIHGQDPSLGCVIEVKQFKALMDCIVPVNNRVRLRSDSDGMKVITSDYMGKIIVSAFLPKESFAKYEELGVIGIDAAVTRKFLVGLKKSMRIKVDTERTELEMTFGSKQSQHRLFSLDYIREDTKLPEIDPACIMVVSSEEFVNALKSAKEFMESNNQKRRGSRYIVPDVRFLVNDNVLELVCKTLDNDFMRVGCTSKQVQQTGQVNSRFNIDVLSSLKQTILRSKEVTLGLGMMGPMILDLVVERTKIRYFVDTLDAI